MPDPNAGNGLKRCAQVRWEKAEKKRLAEEAAKKARNLEKMRLLGGETR